MAKLRRFASARDRMTPSKTTSTNSSNIPLVARAPAGKAPPIRIPADPEPPNTPRPQAISLTGSDDEDDDGPRAPTINDVESLREGIINVKDNITQSDYTILVVGETGVGKSSVLEFIANVIGGIPAKSYSFDIIDKANESGLSGKDSQTNSAMLYTFVSQNGQTVRILDTPGLADTRGIEMDDEHKKSIANAIARSITTVNAVLILANGTVPRLTVSTEYALVALSAIFPRSLANNICFMFTNVASPLSWNFDQATIPTVLLGAPQFLLDNPIALQRKFNELKDNPNTSKQLEKEMRRAVEAGEVKALETMVRLFDWLDGLSPQPTKDILSLYERSQKIEIAISKTLANMDQAALKRARIDEVRREILDADSKMKIFKKFETEANREAWVYKDTPYHNTLCTIPQCYSICHENCGLNFTLDPEELRGCASMQPDQENCNQPSCGHPRSVHRHYNVKWGKEFTTEKIVDQEMRTKFTEATSKKAQEQKLMDWTEKALNDLTAQIHDNTNELASLAEEYSQLSLSGSFSGLVEKAVEMIKLNMQAMKEKGVGRETLQTMQGSLDAMVRKLEVLKAAQKKKQSSRIIDRSALTGPSETQTKPESLPRKFSIRLPSFLR